MYRHFPRLLLLRTFLYLFIMPKRENVRQGKQEYAPPLQSLRRHLKFSSDMRMRGVTPAHKTATSFF